MFKQLHLRKMWGVIIRPCHWFNDGVAKNYIHSVYRCQDGIRQETIRNIFNGFTMSEKRHRAAQHIAHVTAFEKHWRRGNGEVVIPLGYGELYDAVSNIVVSHCLARYRCLEGQRVKSTCVYLGSTLSTYMRNAYKCYFLSRATD